ncbi:hypothetical protein [Clostridium gasigenes]|uniref:hypothetical protein n=1 Tax=Clostridium gasigenes TaxID=94869 RepID=UPI001C0C96A6|nr:hypothetical protein [Clostridium gasigenes]MBU3104305.1 hypothetical protein [Clostridium gasigenes]
MKDIIVDLNIPQETKDFLCNTKIKKNEFESLGIEFVNKEQGFLFDVVEWTKINDCTLKELNKEFVREFLGELEKFRDYYVVAQNCDTGNLISIHKSTGKIYELEHEVTEEVVRYFVNSSFAKMYESMKCFKKIKSKIIKLKEQEKIEEIELLFEKSKKDFSLIDSKVVINDDEYNRQFWNGVLESYKEWCLD